MNQWGFIMKKKAFDINDIEFGAASVSDFLMDDEEDDACDLTAKKSSKKSREDEIISILFAPTSPLSGNRKARKAKNKQTFKVYNISELKGFVRVANTNTLIRISDQDFWSLKQAEDGSYEIERLVDDEGNPIKAK